MSNDVLLNRPRRRHYSNELKAEVVQTCNEPGASIAAIALSHGINANIVHRWVRERGDPLAVQQAFVPMPMPTPSAVLSHDGDQSAVIEIELRRGSAVASIRWPLKGASACAALLRDWLR